MKIVTITTLRSINYGGVLQAFALHKFLKQNNCENKVLDYCKLKSPYQKLNTTDLRQILIVLVQNFFYFIYRKQWNKLFDNFDKFIDNNIELTEYFSNFSSLKDKCPSADLFVTGSDQVFGVRGEYDNIRMLQFVPKEIPCASYAASLGEYDWTNLEKQEFINRLKRIETISVREKYAADYISLMTGRQCNVNIDPVFLIDKREYEKVSNNSLIPDTPYILCYSLVSNEKFQQLMDAVKKQTGYETVCIHTFPMKRLNADRYIFNAGPAEFLGLIENAEFVITTSFHGTAFSILFEKPFYTLIRNYKSQRITELLEKLNLSDRLYNGQKIDFEVDYSKAHQVILKEREAALNYIVNLKKNIQNNDFGI